MPKILDSKTDVIHFELTKAGRKELANGTLQPAYVSFFDDNVVYTISDTISERQDLIFTNTLPLSALNLNKNSLKYPLGKSTKNNTYIPAWDLVMLNGAISDEDFIPGENKFGYKRIVNPSSSYYNKNMVLDDLNIKAEIVQKNRDFYVADGGTYQIDNSRYLKIENDYVLIDLQEMNSDDGYANFDIEIYIEDHNAGGEKLNKLQFIKKSSNIIDGIIYDDDELPSKYNDIDLDSTKAEYFFDVLVDSEIDVSIIAAAQSAAAALATNKLVPSTPPETPTAGDAGEPCKPC